MLSVWPNIFKFIVLHLLALHAVTLLPSLSVATLAWLVGSYIFAGLCVCVLTSLMSLILILVRSGDHGRGSPPLVSPHLQGEAAPEAGADAGQHYGRGELHLHLDQGPQDPPQVLRDTRRPPQCQGEGRVSNVLHCMCCYQRGFFFSHMGWLCVRKHPAVTRAGRTISMSDLEADPLVMTQHRHYLKCFVVAAFLLPSLVPTLWGEDIVTAYFISVLRYVAVLHFTWLVNSAAHM